MQPEPVPRAHAAALELARAISEHLSPRTGAYHEIWLDGEKVVDTQIDEEPIYGRHYLPRKFKTVVAVPPSNDVDVFAQDLGFIAITGENDEVVGYDVAVGGGMGMTHGEPETFPRTADVMGFAGPSRQSTSPRRWSWCSATTAIAAIASTRASSTRSRTAASPGSAPRSSAAWAMPSRRRGRSRSSTPATATAGCRTTRATGTYTLFVQNGRVLDRPDRPMRTGLAEIARVHQGDFRLTANQNLMIARVQPRHKRRIEKLLAQYRLDNDHSGLRLNSLACVALPTCASRWPRASATCRTS